MSVREPVLVELGRRTAYLSGPLGAIWMAALKTGVPAMKCTSDSTKVSVPIDRVDDVLAYLEHSLKRRVQIVEVSR